MAAYRYQDRILHHFQESKRTNPQLSGRAFARYLGISHTTFSQLLTGKKTISSATAEKIAVRLKLPVSEIRRFCLSALLQQHDSELLREIIEKEIELLDLAEKSPQALEPSSLGGSFSSLNGVIPQNRLNELYQHLKEWSNQLPPHAEPATVLFEKVNGMDALLFQLRKLNALLSHTLAGSCYVSIQVIPAQE